MRVSFAIGMIVCSGASTGSGLGGSDVFGPAVKGGSVTVVEPPYPGYVVISPTGCTQ